MILAEIYFFEMDKALFTKLNEKAKVSEVLEEIRRTIKGYELFKKSGLISTRTRKFLKPEMSFEDQGIMGGDKLVFFTGEKEETLKEKGETDDKND